MNDTITLSRTALESSISAALLQESHNSFVAGAEGSSPLNENQAEGYARQIVDQALTADTLNLRVCFHCGAGNPGGTCGHCGGNN